MTTWFTSDTHFGHARIIELCGRPFRDVQTMNEMIVANWNAVVSPADRVFHLGDVALGSIEDTLRYVARLNGHKTLVRGNHDRNFRGGKKSRGLEPHEWDRVYADAGFESVQGNLVLAGWDELDGEAVNVSHFPYEGDSHGDERHVDFRFADNGLPLVHGHVHATGDPVTYSSRRVQVIDPDDASKKRKIMVSSPSIQVHVGVDAWDFTPVNAATVASKIREARRRLQSDEVVV